MSCWIMKDMSLAPLDQQAGQEMEVSVKLAKGGKKSCALLRAASQVEAKEQEETIGQRRNAGQ